LPAIYVDPSDSHQPSAERDSSRWAGRLRQLSDRRRRSSDVARIRNDERLIAADQLSIVQASWRVKGSQVTYQIVEQLRGTIRVKSEPPQTEFSVALPLSTAA
jgi:hypothetical protein